VAEIRLGPKGNVAAAMAKHFEMSNRQIEKAIARGLFRAATRGRALFVKRSPVGATGDFRRSWSMPVVLPDGRVEITNTAPHADIVEFGSRPHMPPVEPLVIWVKRVLGVKGAAAQRIAWAIAMHIKEHGTKPQHIMLGARPELEKYAQEEVQRAIEQILGR
jgi:hypothetical protein